MVDVLITGSGFYVPETVLTNEELVDTFNEYVDKHNQLNKSNIDAGVKKPLRYSSTDFIQNASGIFSRHVIEKEGIIDVEIMHPQINDRSDDMISLQAEFGINAAKEALANAKQKPKDIDAVIVGASGFQRSYPAIAIEIQEVLGIEGFAFDMNVACSSASFAISTAENYIKQGAASKVLVINPELMTTMLDFHDRDSHFIFGDAASALVLEGVQDRQSVDGFKIIDSKLKTMFSNNIRFNYGHVDKVLIDPPPEQERLFKQNGRKVFKEVINAARTFHQEQLASLCLTSDNFKRLWLHQANSNMNRLIAERFYGKKITENQAPNVLDKYANTGSSGAVIAFHLHHDDFEPGEYGLLSSFGAGYSLGSIVLQKR